MTFIHLFLPEIDAGWDEDVRPVEKGLAGTELISKIQECQAQAITNCGSEADIGLKINLYQQ